ncbi:MAG: peptidyl-tRNA hydrolase Pth2 [Candidatus Diapherotrites archaeon]|nr:peptidyl-tRNA hydrolase Pth2 [Candidatus Diapherotrites archaeon]
MFKQAIVLRTDLEMGKGKLVAQGAHASIEAYLRTAKKKPEWATLWLAEGMKKIVLRVGSKEELTELFEEVKNLIPSTLITDAGHTQIPPGTLTALGVGPAPEIEIDKFFSKYKLL